MIKHEVCEMPQHNQTWDSFGFSASERHFSGVGRSLIDDDQDLLISILIVAGLWSKHLVKCWRTCKSIHVSCMGDILHLRLMISQVVFAALIK